MCLLFGKFCTYFFIRLSQTAILSQAIKHEVTNHIRYENDSLSRVCMERKCHITIEIEKCRGKKYYSVAKYSVGEPQYYLNSIPDNILPLSYDSTLTNVF